MWVVLFCPFSLCHHHFYHKCLANIGKYTSKKGYTKPSGLFFFLEHRITASTFKANSSWKGKHGLLGHTTPADALSVGIQQDLE